MVRRVDGEGAWRALDELLCEVLARTEGDNVVIAVAGDEMEEVARSR